MRFAIAKLSVHTTKMCNFHFKTTAECTNIEGLVKVVNLL